MPATERVAPGVSVAIPKLPALVETVRPPVIVEVPVLETLIVLVVPRVMSSGISPSSNHRTSPEQVGLLIFRGVLPLGEREVISET